MIHLTGRLPMSSDLKNKSRFLSLILRHDPEAIGMTLNQQGWADIDDILAKAPGQITRDEILQIVATSDKQRFALSPDQTRIRANQGHSVKVDLGLAPILPKTVLFHGI